MTAKTWKRLAIVAAGLLLLLLALGCSKDGTAPPPPPATYEAAFPRRAFGYDLHVYGVGRLYSLDSALYGGSDTVAFASPDSTFEGGPARIVTVGDTVWGTFRLIDSTYVPVLDTIIQLWVWTPGRDDFQYTRYAGEEFLAIIYAKNPVHEFYFVLYNFWTPPTQTTFYVYDGADAHQTISIRWGGEPFFADAALRLAAPRGFELRQRACDLFERSEASVRAGGPPFCRG